MALASRPWLTFNMLFWVAVTIFGAYFLWHIVNPQKGEKSYLNFGIDLVGGTYLTLDVKVEEAIKNDLMVEMQNFVDQLKTGSYAKDGGTTAGLGGIEAAAATDESKASGAALGKKIAAGTPTVDAQTLKGTVPFESDAQASEALKIAQAKPGMAKVTQDGKNLIFTFASEQLKELEKEAIDGNISILRTRLDAFGAGEVAIIPQGERRISIELPNVSDPEKAKARIGTAAILELKPVYDEAQTKEELIERAGGSVPEGSVILPVRKAEGGGFVLVPAFAKLTGKLLKNAQRETSQTDTLSNDSPHMIALEFKPEGRAKFADMTREMVGRRIAIVIDNLVIMAPSVKGPIDTGKAYISGRDFTQEYADEISALLKSGAFSAPVEVIEERQVGPSLGKESITKGLMSCLIALALLFLFSVIVYKTAGLFAFIVLLYNLLLILFGLALVPDATLTLPGIAGMILTVGMAIDSSILIYERIKEELAAGSSLNKAVDSGFNGALSVILDANITTFIIGAVLYYFGSPAIQGFALTMMIGIIATLITGLVLLKTIFNFVLSLGVKKIAI